MQNKKIYLKFLINSLIIAVVLINNQFVIAQSQTNDFKKIKIDGLAAVVGDFVILER